MNTDNKFKKRKKYPSGNTKLRKFGMKSDFKAKSARLGAPKKKNKAKQSHSSLQHEEQEIEKLQERYPTINSREITSFRDLPLSSRTLTGLLDCNYKTPTDIQRESIGPALQGKDVLAAAKTGSGKTLAFLIPILENLFVKKWTRLDGLGAIIISPTRELALQIHETLKKVGKLHDISYGLIIGGQNLKYEKNILNRYNIMICTPGRLLQHMDENPLFECTNMQILVLDEADRCLDMGFAETMNSIIENLPATRQTLLYSATQTKSVKDLARLSLKDAVYIAPHDKAEFTTPETLQQNYVVIDLEKKFTMLWSFLKSHMRQKIIVFFATCKQVKYFYELFTKLRSGIAVLPLYGGMNQERRNKIYSEFCQRSNVCLLATDIASRGLDFPKINWVVQLDCPEDVAQYIHRAGRTARHKASGENLLILMPSEEKGMLELLEKSKIPISEIHVDEKQMFTPRAKVEGFLAKSPELKESAKRAFVAYVKSVVFMKNKKIFNVDSLNLDEYSNSLGLIATPRVRFLAKIRQQTGQKAQKADEEGKPFDFSVGNEDDDEDDGDFIKVKRQDHDLEGHFFVDEDETPKIKKETEKEKKIKPMTKVKLAKKALVVNKKIVFDEEGNQDVDPDEVEAYNIDKAKQQLQIEDKKDKERYKQLLKDKRQVKKEKLQEKAKEEKEEQDDFGSDEDGVDLSWLPDPDKVYKDNKKDEYSKYDHLVGNSSEDEESSEEEQQPPLKKKKTVEKAKKIAKDLSLDDAEEMAMKLLYS